MKSPYAREVAIGIGKHTDVSLECKYSVEDRSRSTVASFSGLFGDEGRDEYDFPRFREGTHSKPASVQGLRELLGTVRDLARDLRERGRCPGCEGHELRVLGADFCANCCLSAVALQK